MVATMTVVRVVMATTGVVLLGIALWTFRENDGPALRPFVLFVAVVGTLAVADGIGAGSPTWLSVVWLTAYLAIPTAYGGFVVEYYGLPYLATWRRRALFVLPAALALAGGVVLIFEPAAKGAMLGGGTFEGVRPTLPEYVISGARLAEGVGLYYAGGVMVAASGLMLRTTATYEHLDARLGVVLSFVAVWPWVAYLLTPSFVGTLPVEGLVGGATTGYVLSTAAAGFAVTRGGLFDAAPAAGTLGPETVLENLAEAVVVVDHDERVVRVNAAAAETFGVDPGAVVGEPLASVVGTDLATLAESDDLELDVVGGTRHFEATVTPVTDRRGRSPGKAVVLSDVTRQRIRLQRLGVLNRVLRHNLRNEMSHIIGRAEIIADNGEYGDLANDILSSADDLIDVGERAREVEEMMAMSTDPSPSTALREAATNVVDDYRETYPDATLAVDVPASLSAAVDERVFVRALDNLVENALEHNDAPTPVVSVSARPDPEDADAVRVSVTDNGPGLPAHERKTLESGEETALEHGSGLGLWAVSWAVTRMGGSLRFVDNEPRGTVVTIRLPRDAAEEGTEEAGTSPVAAEAE